MLVLIPLSKPIVAKLGIRTGYDGAAEVQSASALTGITIVYVILPIVLNVLCIFVLSFYKLEKEYPTILKELEARRNRAQAAQ